MSLTRFTKKPFALAVVVALCAVFFLQPAAANPPESPLRPEPQRSLDSWHGIHDYKAGDGERRINLRMAVRARPTNGYTYVKGYVAVTCETLTASGWRRYPCSTKFEFDLGVQGGAFGGYAFVFFSNSGADGFYSIYTTPWVRTICPTTILATAASGHAGVDWLEFGLHYKYFEFGSVTSDPYSLACN